MQLLFRNLFSTAKLERYASGDVMLYMRTSNFGMLCVCVGHFGVLGVKFGTLCAHGTLCAKDWWVMHRVDTLSVLGSLGVVTNVQNGVAIMCSGLFTAK